MLLVYGGGVYLQIGCTECMPRVFVMCKSFANRFLCNRRGAHEPMISRTRGTMPSSSVHLTVTPSGSDVCARKHLDTRHALIHLWIRRFPYGYTLTVTP